MTTEEAKKVGIKEFLARLGITPARSNDRSGMYLSPLRDEHTPSFCVNYVRNVWYDHGIGKGGGIIDLVMHMQSCGVSQALHFLEVGERTHLFARWIPPLHPELLPRQEIVLERVNDLANHALLAYITSRGISENVAKHNCKQVHYSTSDKYYYAIGFANNSGGWELRNPYFKGSSSPKDITTILKGSNEVAIFEGFMDFLSYLTIKGKQDSMSDIVVMNSLRLIDRVLPFLKNYDVIRTYLDNDDAGRKSTEELFSKSATSKILDCSSTYSKFKDLNDYLQSTMQEKNQYRGNFKIRH